MTKTETASPVTNVKSEPGDRWATVTIQDSNGDTRNIRVRKGSMFSKRPKPTPTK